MTEGEVFDQALARFWSVANALIKLRSAAVLDAAADSWRLTAVANAMSQRAKNMEEAAMAAASGCVCYRCVEVREQIAARDLLKAQLGDVCEVGAFDDV